MAQPPPFSEFASRVAAAAGRPLTFVVAVGLVATWALSGPLFGFSDTWQLVINTSTTIVTFLMVFLIQTTQNRDGAAIQAKLDELVRASAAHDRYIGIEGLTEDELEELRLRCAMRASGNAADPSEDDESETVADRKAKAASG